MLIIIEILNHKNSSLAGIRQKNLMQDNDEGY